MKQFFKYIILIICMLVSAAILGYAGTLLAYFFPYIPDWSFVALAGAIVAPILYYKWNVNIETDHLKYEYVSIIMHKFRTPITAIKWSIESIKSASSAEESKPFLDKIESSSGTLIDLTDKVVSISDANQIEHLYNFEHANCAQLVKSIIAAFMPDAQKKNISVKVLIDEALPVTTLDIDKIKFVFEVLIKNAISYTPKDGTVEIIGMKDGTASKPNIVFHITDSGIGILPEEFPYIFRKFFRGEVARSMDVEGMGIGLHLAYMIIQRHLGTIKVDSKGRSYGTTFTVTLPVR